MIYLGDIKGTETSVTFETNDRDDDEDAIIRDFSYLNIQTGRCQQIYPNRKR